MADYGGNAIFGLCVRSDMDNEPSEAQINTYFGVSGVFSLFGGGRGRLITVSGVLVGPTPAALMAGRTTILSYDDGVGRVLTDEYGLVWPAVVFTGRFRWTGPEGYSPLVGWAKPYECLFAGRI